MRLIVRFDVDTWPCAHTGMPFLIDFARSLDARFSFMVNMGRSVSRRMYLRKALGPPSAEPPFAVEKIAKLGSLERMGLAGYVQAAALNPMVGRSAGAVLRHALEQGHVLGLHGGRNHGEWQWGAHTWSFERLRSEVRWGLDAFESVGLPRPTKFSSPGWNSPASLPQVLTEQGFVELHDSHRPGELNRPGQRVGSLSDFNTAFAGEPGGVGYFESALVKSLAPESLADTIVSALRAEPLAIGMVYDHPVLCAGVGQKIFCATLELLRERGVALVASHNESHE